MKVKIGNRYEVEINDSDVKGMSTVEIKNQARKAVMALRRSQYNKSIKDSLPDKKKVNRHINDMPSGQMIEELSNLADFVNTMDQEGLNSSTLNYFKAFSSPESNYMFSNSSIGDQGDPVARINSFFDSLINLKQEILDIDPNLEIEPTLLGKLVDSGKLPQGKKYIENIRKNLDYVSSKFSKYLHELEIYLDRIVNATVNDSGRPTITDKAVARTLLDKCRNANNSFIWVLKAFGKKEKVYPNGFINAVIGGNVESKNETPTKTLPKGIDDLPTDTKVSAQKLFKERINMGFTISPKSFEKYDKLFDSIRKWCSLLDSNSGDDSLDDIAIKAYQDINNYSNLFKIPETRPNRNGNPVMLRTESLLYDLEIDLKNIEDSQYNYDSSYLNKDGSYKKDFYEEGLKGAYDIYNKYYNQAKTLLDDDNFNDILEALGPEYSDPILKRLITYINFFEESRVYLEKSWKLTSEKENSSEPKQEDTGLTSSDTTESDTPGE